MDLASLFEMDWYDKSPMTAVLARNRGRWVHFSQGAPNRDLRQITALPEPDKPGSYSARTAKRYQRDLTAVRRKNATQPVPKLGINPRSMWQDPKGVYFYPVDWLLSGAERIRTGNQYGLHFPYYYIVELNLNDPNGINLGTITWDQIEAIAKRNGWYEQMQEFRQLPVEDQKQQLFHYSRPDLPGSFFWHFIDRQVKDGKMRWAAAYRGVSFIRDPNLSIIHSNEPDQVLVLDPRVIKVVEFGENKRPVTAGGGSDTLAQWWHVLLTVIKQVRGEFGGDLAWKNKRPTLTFSKNQAQFDLTVPERSAFSGEVGLSLTYTWGRAEGSIFIKYETLTKSTVGQVVSIIGDEVNKVARQKSDLLFKPIVTIDQADDIMRNRLADHLDLSVETTIHNSDTPNYNSVLMSGKTQREFDRVAIRTECYMSLKPTDMDASCNVWVGKHHMMHSNIQYEEDFTTVEPMLAAVSARLRPNITQLMREFAPTAASDRYSRHPRFAAEQVTPFVGWLILHCGISCDGLLHKEFAEEIAAFQAYPDKRVLLSDIAYVMNSRW